MKRALLALVALVWLASVAMTVSGFLNGLSAPGRWSGFVVMLVVTLLATGLVVVAARRLTAASH
ncbi:hypothetical protein SAMN05421812_10751 [Asanoa hainanensis]|uniref:Uncharacterized protein n=1 Tax=Asanoa hainanensis TaxID=560556 RepID=A0A239N1J2_9ACTN|nr:hypothetical protein [Asanoa hainanensis]SNT48019.1 hypothetical protein SAMN05421812_10751 [Asanoa hainanensis]